MCRRSGWDAAEPAAPRTCCLHCAPAAPVKTPGPAAIARRCALRSPPRARTECILPLLNPAFVPLLRVHPRMCAPLTVVLPWPSSSPSNHKSCCFCRCCHKGLATEGKFLARFTPASQHFRRTPPPGTQRRRPGDVRAAAGAVQVCQRAVGSWPGQCGWGLRSCAAASASQSRFTKHSCRPLLLLCVSRMAQSPASRCLLAQSPEATTIYLIKPSSAPCP